ncbi:acylphosphatase [Thiogranum longum]
MTVCYRCIVNGRVQGVFFRAATQREAQQLGLTGYARNLADGSVEVLACGERGAVERLKEWLWLGPPSANVTGVECQAVDRQEIPERFGTA